MADEISLLRYTGMYAALCAHLQPGDEVILIEPYFDQYYASIVFNGGVPVFVPLHPPTGDGVKHGKDWKVDFEEFRYVTLMCPHHGLTSRLPISFPRCETNETLERLLPQKQNALSSTHLITPLEKSSADQNWNNLPRYALRRMSWSLPMRFTIVWCTTITSMSGLLLYRECGKEP